MNELNRLPGLSVLRAFEATVRTGGVSIAARELNVTDGAISRAIKEMERQIGAPLFERRGRTLVPIPHALNLAREIAHSLELTLVAIEDMKRRVNTRPWVISCEPTLLIRWLIPRITSLQKALGKDNELQFVSAGGPVNFASKGIDFAIRRKDFEQNDNAVTATFMKERIGPVCRKNDQDLYFNNTELTGTLLHTATRPEAWGTWSQQTRTKISYGNEIKFEHFYQSIQAAVSGAGIAIGPIALVADDIEAGVLIAPKGFVCDGTEYVLMAPAGKENNQIFESILGMLRIFAIETEQSILK